MKKLLIELCTKTVFSYNIFHQPCDGVSRGSLLALVIVIVVVKPLKKCRISKFYC